MQTTLGAGARLSVQIAWGADLTQTPDTWAWTDITSDVRQDNQVHISVGKSGEAGTTQPATCTFRLDNRTGDYSLGAQSRHWPYVRRNTPVRVMIDPDNYGNAFYQAFLGYVDGFTPAWSDVSGADGYVDLSASGVLRRLAQGSSPVLSSLRRAITDRTDVVAYWPCEDGKNSVSMSSAFPGYPPMLISGGAEQPYPKFASDSTFVCSQALPEVALTSWRGRIPPYVATGSVQVRWLMKAPKLLNGTTARLISVQTTGSTTRWDVYYVNAFGGDLMVRAFDTTGAMVLEQEVQFDVNETTRMYTLALTQVGSGVSWTLESLAVNYYLGNAYGDTVASQTVVGATSVAVAPDQTIDDTIIGHVCVQNTITSLHTEQAQLNANNTELAHVRIARLCAENQMPVNIIGTSGVLMGAQTVDTLVSLLRECELADQGILYDGRDAGLTYICGSHRVNAAAAITIDSTRGDLAKELAPVDDDQRNVNKAKADRKNGGSAVIEDTDGNAGTAAIGIYDTSLTVNINSDGDIVDYAGWAVHKGTVTGYRYPKLQINLARNPGHALYLGPGTYLGASTFMGDAGLAARWLKTHLSDRVDVTGLSTIRAGQLPDGTLTSLLEGYSQTIDQFRWDVQLNLSPYAPWQVAELTAGPGDAREHALRLESDGSTLASNAAPAAGLFMGATTFLGGSTFLGDPNLHVTTPSGPRWTTDPAQFPFDIEVGGLRLTVLAITGTGSAQVFLIATPTYSKTLPAGSDVTLWQPPVLGI